MLPENHPSPRARVYGEVPLGDEQRNRVERAASLVRRMRLRDSGSLADQPVSADRDSVHPFQHHDHHDHHARTPYDHDYDHDHYDRRSGLCGDLHMGVYMC